MTNLNSQFVKKVKTNLAYWRETLAATPDGAVWRLDGEREGLFRAVGYGRKLPDTFEEAARLALQVYPLVERMGYWYEWIPVLEGLLAACPAGHPRLRVQLLTQVGTLYRNIRDLDAAVAAHRKAAQWAEYIGDDVLLAHAHARLGADYKQKGQYKQAEHYVHRALTALRTLDAPANEVAIALTELGLIAYRRGQWETAEEWLAQAVIALRQTDRLSDLARTMHNLAVAQQMQEKYEAAVRTYREAERLLAGTDYNIDKAMVQMGLGSLFYQMGDLEGAGAAYRRVNARALEQAGHDYYRAFLAQGLGNVLLNQGRLAQAEPHLRQALALWQQSNDEVNLGNTEGTLAELRALQGKRAEADTLYEKAIVRLARHPDSARARRLRQEFIEQRAALWEEEE